MFEAIKTGRVPFRNHLAQCESCRQLFELLSLSGEADQSALTAPSPASLYRARAIALQDRSRQPERSLKGELAHDSWSGLPAQQVRDAAFSGERRLRFKTGETVLDLVIEKTAGQFELVARVYEKGLPSTRYLLQIGRRKLYPENHNCFYWNSTQAPRRISLLSPSVKLDFGTLAW